MSDTNFIWFNEKNREKKRSNEDKKTSNRFFMENNIINLDDKIDEKIRKRKRRRRSFEDLNIEERYFKKLLKDENENEKEDNIKKKEKNENIICKFDSNNKQNSLEKKEIDLDESLKKDLSTIFVGNLPLSIISLKSDYKTFKTKFSEFGKIKSIRFRSIAFSEFLPKKIAYIQRKFHPKRDMVNAYIVYETEESSKNALVLNGTLLLNRHIRVDSVAYPTPHVSKRSIFIGNLSFDAQEEQLWSYFGQCGEIEFVRIVRNSKTNVGKGFAYVQFINQESIDEALLLHDKKGPFNRKLRIVRAKNISKRKSKSKYEEITKDLNTKSSNENLTEKTTQINIQKAPLNKRKTQKLINNMVFEGKRASKSDSIKILTKKKHKDKPQIKNKTKQWKKRRKNSSK
ncbi:hypothetical protein PNEG_00102 [Pneumocystis murina B123]|uniref:Nucleolar protein 12 n=1 Tax=Pneumocystis murina (strain B123) TaxID=1069680 RepID=M7PMG5_PNEMU|nr:hypothetical protein PNEG_00102 [Pneumocystis murina B123]EMR11664.1 hypothetical protein PNEG_00102 [Pneumocystis murina B123]